MRIIVLKGSSGSGKTSTLVAVNASLINRGATSTNRKQEGGNPNDFSDILSWKGKQIAILTMGDFAKRVINDIDKYSNLGCDFFVTACNDSFLTPFGKLANHDDKCIINKVYEPDRTRHQAILESDVRKILCEIQIDPCDFTNTLSQKIYQKLTAIFSHKLKMSETGITDYFIYKLIAFTKTFSGVEIYSTGSKKESIYGNDIDLFIRGANGKYSWFALQAKVMSYNGAYKDLKNKTNPNQWDKLLEHERRFKSKSFYLLYNGQSISKPIKTSATRADCIGIPVIEELGMGIVETTVLKNIRESKKTHAQIFMKDLFPDNMDSIRKLFCCDVSEYPNLESYSYEDIKKDEPYKEMLVYDKVSYSAETESTIESDEIELIREDEEADSVDLDIAPIRLIINPVYI